MMQEPNWIANRMLAITLVILDCVGVARGAPGPREAARLPAINSIGMQFRLVPAGEFMMGSPVAEKWRDREECLHRVRISQSFEMGVHEVRVKDFRAFIEDTGYQTDAERGEVRAWFFDKAAGEACPDTERKHSWRNPGFEQTEEHPVVIVTWCDAQKFCAWLSAREQRLYRLPTEAEWEYAARAGTQAPFPGGDFMDVARYANVGDISFWSQMSARFRSFNDPTLFRFPFDDGYPFTAPVCRFLPNRLGLHDMTGNVAEHCQDYFYRDAYLDSPIDDPVYAKRPDSQVRPFFRVARGGAFNARPLTARIAHRGIALENAAQLTLGFRVVRAK